MPSRWLTASSSPIPPSLRDGRLLADRLSALTHDLLAAADGARRLVWSNPAWQLALDWTAAELAARSYHELIHPEDLERVRAAERAVLGGRAGTRPETTLRLRARDGSYRWFLFSTSYAPRDELVFFCGKDITERKRGEDELRAAEERYHAVTQSTQDAIISADVDGRIIFWNAGAEAMFGRSEREALGQPLTILMPERHRAAHEAGLARFLATGETRVIGSTVEVEGLRAGGGEFPMELSLGSWSHSGRCCFTGVVRDLSDRVHARRALREAEERFAGAFEGAAVGMLLAAPDGTLLRVNRALSELTGRSADELTGRALDDLVQPGDSDSARPAIDAMLAGETQRIATERRLLTADGSTLIVRINLSLIRAGDGQPLYFAGQLEDVTERRRVVEALTRSERSLEQRARDLERSNSELEQFAYVASHDLSEPLRMVSSYLQLLRRRYHGSLDADADEFIDYAVAGANRMRDLIDDLLTFSRAGRGDYPLGRVATDAIVARVVEDLRGQEDARPARVTIGPLPEVVGDAQQLGQLFQNVIGNAIKFVPDEREPAITVTAEREGSHWRFEVTDNGIGFDTGQTDRIFRMFQRLHSRDEYPGTGIGLAIAKKVVERHGGRIWAESRAEGGSRFWFTLRAPEPLG